MVKGVVIAGNYKQYTDWLQKNKKDRKEYIYAFRFEHIAGLSDVEVIFAGKCWVNPLSQHPSLAALRSNRKKAEDENKLVSFQGWCQVCFHNYDRCTCPKEDA